MRIPLLAIVLLSLSAPGWSQPASDDFSDEQFQEEVHGGMERVRQERLDKHRDEARQTLDAFEAELHAERLQALIEIHHLGNVAAAQRTSKLEEELEKKGVAGGKYKGGDLLDPSFAERTKRLATARESLDRLHGLDATRDRGEVKKRVASLDREVMLGHLEGQRFRMKQSLESLTSESMTKAMASPEVDAGVRERLKAERDRLVERLRDLSVLVSRQDSRTDGKVEVGLAAKVSQAVGDADVFESFRLLSNAERKPETRPVFKEFTRDLSLGDYKGAWKRLQN